MSRAARLLDLLQALRNRRRPVSAQLLADELGVSVRTAYRDIATLAAQGAPIRGEPGVGYVLDPAYFLPPLAFDADETDALLLALQLAEKRGDDRLAEASRRALGKILAVLPRDAAPPTDALLVPPRARLPHLGPIRDAIRRERKLRFRYVDKAGQPSDRLVWPVAVGFFEAAEVLAAWCELRRGFRHFRLDRMEASALLDERYPARHRALLAQWRATIDPDKS